MTMSQHFNDRNRPADSSSNSTFYDSRASTPREQQPPYAASQNSYAPQDLRYAAYRLLNANQRNTKQTCLDRSQRKAAPSPLQTSSSAKSQHHSGNSTPTTGVFTDSIRGSPGRMGELDRQTSLRSDEPRSPKERLDDLLASERSFYDPGDAPSPPMMNNPNSRFVCK